MTTSKPHPSPDDSPYPAVPWSVPSAAHAKASRDAAAAAPHRTPPARTACCESTERASCCDATDKAACCGGPDPATCGCR